MVFAASANVPMFHLLPFEHLDPGLKASCAAIQTSAIRKQLAVDATRPIDHYNLALGLMAGGYKVEAIRSLHQAIALDPGYETAVTALGLLLAESGELDEAALRLSEAVRLAPGKAAPRKYLGMVERRRGALDKAVEDLATALALAPYDSVILSELGIACLQQGRSRQAINYLTRALKVNPQDKESHYFLQLAQELGDGQPVTGLGHQ